MDGQTDRYDETSSRNFVNAPKNEDTYSRLETATPNFQCVKLLHGLDCGSNCECRLGILKTPTQYIYCCTVHRVDSLASLHEKQRTQIQDMLPQQYYNEKVHIFNM